MVIKTVDSRMNKSTPVSCFALDILSFTFDECAIVVYYVLMLYSFNYLRLDGFYTRVRKKPPCRERQIEI